MAERILTKEQAKMVDEINHINDIFYSGRDFEGAFSDFMEGMNKEKAKLILNYMNKNLETNEENIWFKLKDSKDKFLLLQGFYIKGNSVPNIIIYELKDNNDNKEFQLIELNEEEITFDKFQKLSEEEIQTFKTLNVQGKLSTTEDEEFFVKLNAA